MLSLAAPGFINGDLLAQQLAAASLPTTVTLVGDRIELPDLNEASRATAQSVVDAHPATAQAAEARAATERTNATTVRDKASTALADNKAFLAVASPTNAQVVAQVKALTRQNNALIRLALNRFDATD